MANEVVITLASATPKYFNNGVGLVKYFPQPANLTIGSAIMAMLPDNAQLLGMYVELSGAVITPASYAAALIAETTVSAAKMIVTTGAGLTLTTIAGAVSLVVVM